MRGSDDLGKMEGIDPHRLRICLDAPYQKHVCDDSETVILPRLQSKTQPVHACLMPLRLSCFSVQILTTRSCEFNSEILDCKREA
jgi:hypothetical protein